MVDFQPSVLLWIEHTCNVASHFGFLTGSSLASFGPHHMWGYSSFSHIITQSIEFPFSYFYAATTELSAQWASVSLAIQPTVVLIADLSQATFWVFKKTVGESVADSSTPSWTPSISPTAVACCLSEIQSESIFAGWQYALCTIHYG